MRESRAEDGIAKGMDSLHCSLCGLELTCILRKIQPSLKRDRDNRDNEIDSDGSQSESESSGLRRPRPKRQRTAAAAADTPFDCAQCAQCVQMQIRELRGFEQRVMKLISQNLEDTRALR